MKQLQYIFILFAIGVILFNACETPRSYPETPEVEFKSVSITDAQDTLGNVVKLIRLTISVVDGDGDIGIFYLNSNSIYPGFEDLGNANLFIKQYEKIDGEFVELDSVYNYATPFLEPEGQDKTLKADIEVRIDYPVVLYDYDTIKYSFYIYDRAMHISNTAETPEIPFDTLGIIE